jgi:hypothetical protein
MEQQTNMKKKYTRTYNLMIFQKQNNNKKLITQSIVISQDNFNEIQKKTQTNNDWRAEKAIVSDHIQRHFTPARVR